MTKKLEITPADYEALAELRYQIRRFMRFSEQASRGAGLEPRQHQLMLALKGLPANARPRIGELADRLQIQHHSTVELVNRLAAHGLVKRNRGGVDRRSANVWFAKNVPMEPAPATNTFSILRNSKPTISGTA